MTYQLPVCNEKLPCFAKRHGGCYILTTTYHVGERCPFRKEYQDDVPERKKNRSGVSEADRNPKFHSIFLEKESG